MNLPDKRVVTQEELKAVGFEINSFRNGRAWTITFKRDDYQFEVSTTYLQQAFEIKAEPQVVWDDGLEYNSYEHIVTIPGSSIPIINDAGYLLTLLGVQPPLQEPTGRACVVTDELECLDLRCDCGASGELEVTGTEAQLLVLQDRVNASLERLQAQRRTAEAKARLGVQ